MVLYVLGCVLVGEVALDVQCAISVKRDRVCIDVFGTLIEATGVIG